jgi:hypothetical protein
MLSLSPPKVAATSDTTKGLAAKLHITNDAADVTVRFSAVIGPNAVQVEVVKPKTGVAGLAVDFSPPAGATVAGVTLNVPLSAAGVAMLPVEQGLPLGSPGVWTVTVRFGAEQIGSKTVLLTEGAGATTTSPP